MFIFLHIGFFQNPCETLLAVECPPGKRWVPMLCQCVPDLAKCVPPRCPVHPYSPRCLVYREDAAGCPTCTCECDELSQICPVNCPRGVDIISKPNGCRECKCKEAKTCPEILPCEKQCPFGHTETVDMDGCLSCTCRTRSISRRKLCLPVLCSHMCPYGTLPDTNGCPTCSCKPKPVCPVLSCDNFCANGRAQDSNGCEVSCDCRPACGLLVCGAHNNCPNGAKLDSSGCPTCRCKNPPVGRKIQILDKLYR
ncbi:hypothetical protein EGW08_003446 [Elysia chlorotica]|uniref:Antistasin-like domain-containing protein n=1 Tax=Elysia chlorotica TaxID=188477 RepID=A0A3S1BU76_ELYCH|nr:hypothetical protein EGW08_003446 [Elysia chlorotica]